MKTKRIALLLFVVLWGAVALALMDTVSLKASYMWTVLAFMLYMLASFRRIGITCILAGFLLAAPAVRAQFQPPPKPKPDAGLIECGFAIVIVVVGTIVLYKIWRFCDKHFPKPATPPPSPPATNSVPVGSITLASVSLSLGTNDVGWHAFDISDYTNCAPYVVLASTSISSSTSGANWAPLCTVTQWWYPGNVITAVYTNGQLVSAVYASGDGATNSLALPALPESRARMFKFE